MVSRSPMALSVRSSMLEGWLVANHTRGALSETASRRSQNLLPSCLHASTVWPRSVTYPVPLGDEALDLPDHTLHRAADHPPPHRWDYAVTALVIAPGHYGDEGVVPPPPCQEVRACTSPASSVALRTPPARKYYGCPERDLYRRSVSRLLTLRQRRCNR